MTLNRLDNAPTELNFTKQQFVNTQLPIMTYVTNVPHWLPMCHISYQCAISGYQCAISGY